MTAASQILATLDRLGVEVKPDGERILYRPVAAVSAELLAEIKRHKPEILNLLDPERFELGDLIEWDALPKPLACPVCGETVIDCWWDVLDRQCCRACNPPRPIRPMGPRR